MLLEGNSVKSTDIVESASMGDNLSKHQLISLFSLPRDETFISPELLAKVKSFGPNIFKWHRYKFSGRSFAK